MDRLVFHQPAILSIARLLTFAIAHLPFLRAAPLRYDPNTILKEAAEEPGSPGLWIYLAVAVGLVLLGGAFAGLTIALMGQVRYCIALRILLTTLG